MPTMFRPLGAAALILVLGAPAGAGATPAPANATASMHGKLNLDTSGAKRFGKASFYADKYHGRIMSDGTRFDRNSDSAASLTLPLGTTAKVTNLETGRSAIVTIRDRGPYVNGRIIDLSTATANKIGLQRKKGLAEVEVAPIVVQVARGKYKPGVAARDDNDMLAFSQLQQ